MKSLITIILAGLTFLPVFGGKRSDQSRILRWVGERPVADKPVSFGIPFSKGELKSRGQVQLKDSTGQIIPSDYWPLAYWPDGSVKWAGVAAVVPAGAAVSFETAEGRAIQKRDLKTAIHITELPTYYCVNTGKVAAYVPKQGQYILDSLSVSGRRVCGGAALHCTTQDKPYAEGLENLHFENYRSKVNKVVVERVGNVRALLRLEGCYQQASGREWLPFVVRLYFYAGSEQIRMVHSFVFDGDMNTDFIRSLGVRFEVPMREALYNRHIAFATAGGGVWAEPVQPLSGRRILTLDGDKTWQERQMRGERIPRY